MKEPDIVEKLTEGPPARGWEGGVVEDIKEKVDRG